jgi:hypothetical protein
MVKIETNDGDYKEITSLMFQLQNMLLTCQEVERKEEPQHIVEFMRHLANGELKQVRKAIAKFHIINDFCGIVQLTEDEKTKAKEEIICDLCGKSFIKSDATKKMEEYLEYQAQMEANGMKFMVIDGDGNLKPYHYTPTYFDFISRIQTNK